MTAFDELDRAAFGAVEALYGETVRHEPRIGRISAARSDPDRFPVEVTACYTEAPDNPGLFATRRSGATELGMSTVAQPGSMLTIGAAEAEKLSSPPRVGDAFVLVTRSGFPRFGVTRVDRDDVGAFSLWLIRESIE